MCARCVFSSMKKMKGGMKKKKKKTQRRGGGGMMMLPHEGRVGNVMMEGMECG